MLAVPPFLVRDTKKASNSLKDDNGATVPFSRRFLHAVGSCSQWGYAYT